MSSTEKKINRKLTLMNPTQLQDHLKLWEGKQKECTTKHGRDFCLWMIAEIKKEINFKSLLRAGLLYRDKKEQDK